MAFTRNFLKSLSLTDEQVGAIIEEHTNVTDALKSQRDQAQQEAQTYKAEADKVPGLMKQINDASSGEDFKTRYEQEHQAFEDYKAKIAKDAETAKVKSAYRQLLIDERINEKRVDSVMKLTDFSEMKLDKDGKLEGLDALKKTIGEEWGEFKVIQKERKQNVPTPPLDKPTGRSTGRAAELAAKYQQERYGIPKDAGKE